MSYYYDGKSWRQLELYMTVNCGGKRLPPGVRHGGHYALTVCIDYRIMHSCILSQNHALMHTAPESLHCTVDQSNYTNGMGRSI